MATIRKPKRQPSAAERFNELVGNRTGRPSVSSNVSWDAQANKPRQVRRIARGGPLIKASTTKAFRTGSGAGGGTNYNSGAASNVQQGIFDRLVEDYSSNMVEQQAIDAAASEAEDKEEDRPWIQDIGQAIFGAGEEEHGTGGFKNSILGRALNVVSRPPAAIFGGMSEMAAAPQSGAAWWQSPNYYLPQFLSGAWKGLSGQEMEGGGNVYEATKENPTSFGYSEYNPLKGLEETHPALEQTLAIGTGLVLEGVADPLNMVMGGLPTVARETGEVATREVLQNLDARNARTIAEEVAANSPLINANPLYANDPALFGDRVAAAIEQNFDNSVVDVLGGGNKGTRLLNSRTHPAQVASSIVAHIKKTLTEPLERSVSILFRRASAGRMTEATVNGMRSQYSDFDEFWKLLEADAVSRGVTNTTDDILDAIMTGTFKQADLQKHMDAVISKYDTGLSQYYNNALADATNTTYRTIGLRFGTKVVPFKAPGRAYSWVGSKLDNHFPNLANIHFAGVFPGRLGLATGRAKALGFKGFDDFMAELEKINKRYNFTRDEANDFALKLESGGRYGDARKDAGLDFLRDWYDKIHAEEVIAGARGRTGVGAYRDPNYSYIYLRGGKKNARRDFISGTNGRGGRKAAMGNANIHGGGAYTIAEAKKLGLNPVENAFDNLRYRYLKSTRDRTRAEFLNDLVANYSLLNGKPVRKLDAGALRRQGLVPVSDNLLNANHRAMIDIDPGSKFYIPKSIAEADETFRELSGWSSANGGVFMRNWGKVINTLKAWQTLPSTGFHVRNAIGDILLGLMDNINPRAYTWVSKNFALNQAGKTSIFHMIRGHPGAISFQYDEMWDLYSRNADSSFINTEFGTYASSTAGRVPKVFGKTVEVVRNASDKRELIPRFTHFVEAYRQEAQALWDSGMRNTDVIKKRAEDAALFRVNSYKFDYGALLPTEKAVKSLAFPFYTYMRKAAPLLIQQMYTNPHYLSLLGRTMQYNDESSMGEIHKRNFPQLIRDLGFAGLTGGEEPKILRTNFLPTDALSLATNIHSLDPRTWPGELMGKKMWSDILGDMNPLLQIPFERASGRTIFGNKPVGPLPEYLMNKVPFLGEFQQEIADIPLLPGGPSPSDRTYLDRILGNGTESGQEGDPLWQDILSNRSVGGGIPLDTLTEEQQAYQQQANRDLYIENPIKQFNDSNDAVSITVNEDMTYNVNDKISGDPILSDIPSLDAALDFARSRPDVDWQRREVPGMNPPTQEDVDFILGRNR